MLVKLTDHKGKPRWINPLYVKMLVGKGDETEIELSGIGVKLRVRGAPEEVALAIDAATPDLATAVVSSEEANIVSQASSGEGGAAAVMLG